MGGAERLGCEAKRELGVLHAPAGLIDDDNEDDDNEEPHTHTHTPQRKGPRDAFETDEAESSSRHSPPVKKGMRPSRLASSRHAPANKQTKQPKPAQEATKELHKQGFATASSASAIHRSSGYT